MAGMLEIERSRTRRERTFIGSECAVCEEPLEHTLRGERILQFSCGHVSHEACFYEYIKEFESQYCPTCNAPLGLDTSRGGNVLDLGNATINESQISAPLKNLTEKLSSIVRSVSQNNEARSTHQRNGSGNGSGSRLITPVPWDPQTGQERPSSRGSNHRNAQRESSQPQDPRQMEREKERQNRDIQRERIERYGSQTRAPQHNRNESANTGGVHSSGEYGDAHHHNNNSNNNTGRRHDYDVQSMETALSSPRASITKNPIPAPTVTVRSEYPTLTRSRQQQSLTCLVTIEVPEGKWRPDQADLRGAPVLPSMQQDSAIFSNRPASPAKSQQADWGLESPEVLEEITEDLRVRVDNWHGLDFSRYAATPQLLAIYS